jgi:3-deoxy-D-manno-octulosonic-acid transferase
MSFPEAVHGALMRMVRDGSPVAAWVRPSLAPAIAERRAAVRSMGQWAIRARASRKDLVWLHGASAGELLGAVPVVERLRERVDLQLAVTYFSPSGKAAVHRLQPDYAGALPFDTAAECRAAIAALAPSAIVFAKLDVWPTLVATSFRAGVPAGLINATVRPDSSRLRPITRRFLRAAYGRLQEVGAVSEDDAIRLRTLGVDPRALTVTRDAAYDASLQRVAEARESAAAAHRRLTRSTGGPVRLVAGSTWPEDDAVLFPALASLRAAGVDVVPILVPHQPDVATVRRLLGRCEQELGEVAGLWSSGSGLDGTTPLIIDVVGVLAELYLAGDIAYVGGGFGSSGLHSVVEPAAAGLPVLFGPGHSRREAVQLLRAEAAREISPGSVAEVLRDLATRPADRKEMGQKARQCVEREAGGADAGADLVLRLLAR